MTDRTEQTDSRSPAPPTAADLDRIEIAQRWYSPQQIADALSVTPRTVLNWVECRLLTALRVGGVWRISDADLQAFLQRVRSEANAQRAGAEPSEWAMSAAALSRPPVPHRDEVEA